MLKILSKLDQRRKKILASVFWISSLQYFIVQLLVSLNFSPSYSLSQNTISDLGNSTCGIYSDKLVCSKDYIAMNVSFILLGVTMSIGSLLYIKQGEQSKNDKIGFIGLFLSGLGTMLVGAFPENSISALHILGAGIPFLIGNLSLVILSRSLKVSRLFKGYTLFLGLIALVALVLFLTKQYLGLGIGGMERIVAYPQTIWLISYGIYNLRVKDLEEVDQSNQ